MIAAAQPASAQADSVVEIANARRAAAAAQEAYITQAIIDSVLVAPDSMSTLFDLSKTEDDNTPSLNAIQTPDRSSDCNSRILGNRSVEITA